MYIESLKRQCSELSAFLVQSSTPFTLEKYGEFSKLFEPNPSSTKDYTKEEQSTANGSLKTLEHHEPNGNDDSSMNGSTAEIDSPTIDSPLKQTANNHSCEELDKIDESEESDSGSESTSGSVSFIGPVAAMKNKIQNVVSECFDTLNETIQEKNIEIDQLTNKLKRNAEEYAAEINTLKKRITDLENNARKKIVQNAKRIWISQIFVTMNVFSKYNLCDFNTFIFRIYMMLIHSYYYFIVSFQEIHKRSEKKIAIL